MPTHAGRQPLGGALRVRAQRAGLSGRAVKVLTDNLNAANIVNKGSAKAKNSHKVACELHGFCFERDIRLQAEWRPREENKLADFLSKLKDADVWKLHPHAFERLSAKWGPFDVDLFASHTNRQLSVYYSRFFTPDTAGVEAAGVDTAGGGDAGPTRPSA